MATISFLTFTGCADAIVNDGTNVVVRKPSGSGSGGAVPFHLYADVFDIQIWGGTFTANISTESLDITVANASWWGGVLCSDGANMQPIYDMKGIAKVTWEAKSSVDNLAVTFGAKRNPADDGSGGATEKTDGLIKEYTLGTDWQVCEFEARDTEAGPFDVLFRMNGNAPLGTVINIKNITYYDANGNEVVPTVVN